jgi:hypothetical protein
MRSRFSFMSATATIIEPMIVTIVEPAAVSTVVVEPATVSTVVVAAAPIPAQYYETSCPHCDGSIQIPTNGINCQIFRHGVYKTNIDLLVPPHAPKAECERLVAEGLIYGCGMPFTFNGVDSKVCDYI